MKFTTKVQQYDDTQDLYIEIPHYILQTLKWEEGDDLAWSVSQGKIILTKVKDTDSTEEEPTIADYDWYTVKDQELRLLQQRERRQRLRPTVRKLPLLVLPRSRRIVG